MDSLYEAIDQIKNQDLFIYSDSILDFTSKRSVKLFMENNLISLQIPLVESTIKLKEALGALQLFIGGENTVLITWNLKNFLTYARGRTGFDFKLEGIIFDLSFLESYFGETAECPKSFNEARQRLVRLIKKSNWDSVHSVYQKVYLPLIKSIPKIETYGLSHRSKKARVFSTYTIDGQANGRMKCSNVFSSSYNPHSLGFEERENLRTPGFDHCFLNFDFRHMEVSVLQWLSGDERMGEMLNSGKDFYARVWEILTESPSNTERRKICKTFFLPIYYGLGASAMSEKLGWSVSTCKTLLQKVHDLFPVSFRWMNQEANKLGEEGGEVFDYFGRCRVFDVRYKVRNFIVQSPASLICLHKLTQLIEALGDLGAVCMHIHDGYVLSVKKENLHKTNNLTKQILESENELYPGLKLKTGCKVGVNLNKMTIYKS